MGTLILEKVTNFSRDYTPLFKGAFVASIKNPHLKMLQYFGKHVPASKIGEVYQAQILKLQPYFSYALAKTACGKAFFVPFKNTSPPHEGQKITLRVTHDQPLAEPHKHAKAVIIDANDKTAQKSYLSPPYEVVYQCAEAHQLAVQLFPQAKHTLLTQTKSPLFEHFGLAEAWEAAHENNFSLKGGGSLCFEQTTLGLNIDVNASDGQTASRSSVKRVNAEALEKIAELLFLSNESGRILIDFLSFSQKKDAMNFLNDVKKRLNPLNAQVYGYTGTGLIEITRPRLGFSLKSLYTWLQKTHA